MWAMTDKEIVAWIVEELKAGRHVGRKAVRKRFGIGEYRAIRLINQAQRELDPLPQKFAREKGVDLDRYEIERFVVNEWGPPDKRSEQVKVWLKKKEPDFLLGLKEALEKHPRVFLPETEGTAKTMAVLSIFDLHVGMLAWGKEVGENYDTGVAIERMNRAAAWLLDRLPPVDLIVIPVGNDILHADTHNGTTTAGTRVDTDSRWQKAFQDIIAALIAGPLSWAAELAPVHIPIVPGNHDYQRAFYLGEVLHWYFKGRKLHVVVDNAPRLRKYLYWEGVLLGFTHGAWVKVDQLPMLMATEVPGHWGQAAWREWLIGHYHAKREMRYASLVESGGVRVRVMPSLASEDAWHYQMGFVGRHPEATLTLYEAQTGPVAEFFYRP